MLTTVTNRRSSTASQEIESRIVSSQTASPLLLPRCILEDSAGAQSGVALRTMLVASMFSSGNVLAIHMPNCPEYGVAFHAAAVAGGACTTSNPAYTARELHHQYATVQCFGGPPPESLTNVRRLVDSGARFILTSEALLATAKEAALGTSVQDVFCVEEADCFTKAEGTPFTGSAGVESDSTLVLPYSSGTTGLPKGVILTHRNLGANIAQICDHPRFNLGLTDSDTMLGVLPFFHICEWQRYVWCISLPHADSWMRCSRNGARYAPRWDGGSSYTCASCSRADALLTSPLAR